MTESLTSSKKLQWKWIGITLLLYVVFYLSPFFIAHYILAHKIFALFFSGWLFAGIIIIAAIAGYISEGVTLWEPAIAGAGFIALFVIVIAIITLLAGYSIHQSVLETIILMAIFFLLSLLGAWLGERAQKLWKTKSPEST